MTHRIDRKKWILYRHTNSFEMLKAVALYLHSFSKASISEKDKRELLLKLKEVGFYNERNESIPLDSISHRINTLAYYMFGYKDRSEKFLFSPLGNLFLKSINDENKLSRIFLTMLWAVQFKHPHGGSDDVFQLYPFRLIFKLLMEPRLGKTLYAHEVAGILVFTERVDERIYENLVKNILEIRSWNKEKIEEVFKEDEHAYVNAAYEWDYYVSELLKNANVVDKEEGEVMFRLQQGKGTFRFITRNSVKLKPDLVPLAEKLMRDFPFDQVPLRLDDPERLTIDVIKEIYNFYPAALLVEIGEEVNIDFELLNLAKLIEEYSNNNEGEEAYLFEDVLVNGFNLFYNVEAKKIGGAGNTDLECLYITKKEKFAVDAKSTKNKLLGINVGRLAAHRERIGGKYTIVVTPRYVPAALTDIKSSPVVIIMASTFSEYLYNHINRGIRKIDYGDLYGIISGNLGRDISKDISALTLEKFAVRSPT